MRLPILFAASALLFAALPAAAQSFKPGVWEIDNKMLDPAMAKMMAEQQKAMAAMTPAQRKEMDAMARAQGVRMTASGGVQMCVTREMADREDVFVQDGCRTTKKQRSGNTFNLSYTCKDSSGDMTMTVQGPERYTAKVAMHTKEGNKVHTINMEQTGKWVKADCGDLKPPAPAKK